MIQILGLDKNWNETLENEAFQLFCHMCKVSKSIFQVSIHIYTDNVVRTI